MVFHRAPSIYENAKRLMWLESIRKHQTFEERSMYHVCKEHFTDDCFKVVRNRLELIAGSVPTLFDASHPDQFVHINANQSNNNAVLETEQLKVDLIRIRAQHDVERQGMQKKLDSLTKQCNEYKTKAAELKKKNQEIEREKKSLAEKLKNDVICFVKWLYII